MSTTHSADKPSQPQKGWLRRNFFPLLIFSLIILTTVLLFVFDEEIRKLQALGYVGAFVVSVVGNATIILPAPAMVILLPLGTILNPLLLGVVAGVGGAIGEMTSFAAGYSESGIWHDNRAYLRAKAWLQRWGVAVVFVFAALPLPIDLMGLAAGNLRFPGWKYFLACLPGKTIKYIVVAYAGKYGWQSFQDALHEGGPMVHSIVVAGIAGGATAILLVMALALEWWTWRRRQASLRRSGLPLPKP